MGNTELMDSWRQLAVETIVTLAETAPAMLRKSANKFLNGFGRCFHWEHYEIVGNLTLCSSDTSVILGSVIFPPLPPC